MLQDNSEYRYARRRMVRDQLLPRGITDKAVLKAMSEVPRQIFVPEAFMATAYDDRPLPIGYGQTISQPLVVAMMCQLLQARQGMSVLEVGTGTGYQAAVLEAMGLTVFTVERLKPLYDAARRNFRELGLHRVRHNLSDGTMGWPEMGPFDRIIVAAGGPGIPEALTDQLADNGVMIIPVGRQRGSQKLVRVTRHGQRLDTEVFGNVAFVDLVGSYGWSESAPVERTGLRGL